MVIKRRRGRKMMMMVVRGGGQAHAYTHTSQRRERGYGARDLGRRDDEGEVRCRDRWCECVAGR